MQVGDITVKMAADMADLRTGFEQAQAQAAKFGDNVGKAVDFARNALVALGVTAGIAHFASLIKQSIDAADALNDLSKRTGVAVETLGGLGYAGRQSGVDMETLAKSTQKMAVLMAEAAGGGDKASAVFAAMGVSVLKTDGTLQGMDETLFSVADAFATYKDGPEKAALAQEIFGKAGAAMIPLLDEGGDKLRALVAEYQKYGGVTTDTAQKADAFNDTLEKIHLIQGALVRALSAALLPTLQALADIFVDVKGKGSDFQGITGVLVTGIQLLAIAAIAVGTAFEVVGQRLGALAAAAVLVARGEFKQAGDVLTLSASDMATSISTAIDRASKVWNASGAAMVAGSETNGPKMSAPIVKAAKDVGDSILKEWEALEKLRDKWLQVLDATKDGLAPATLKDFEELNTLLATGELNWEQYNAALQHVLDKDPILAAEQKEINANLDAMAKLVDKVNEARAKELDSLDDAIAKQVLSNATFGLGKTAVVDYTIAELQRQQAMAAGVPGEEGAIDQLQRRIEKLYILRDAVALGEGLEQQKKDFETAGKQLDRYLQDAGQAVGGFLTDWMDTGFSNAAKKAWDNFKRWALEALASIAAKQIVVSIVGSVGLTGAAGANPLGGGGLGGIGDIFGNLGNLGSTVSNFAADLDHGVGIVDAFTTALETGGAGLTSLVPVVGGIIAAGTLLYSWLGSKGGGPKDGGFATTGATPGISGTDSTGRWMTPNGMDADAQKAVNGMAAQYAALLAALGGTGSASFAQGFSLDPKGTAPNNAHTGVFAGGMQVFDAANGNVGRSKEELAAELEKQSMRAILAALQASALPTVVGDYLRAIDVSAATVDQIRAALQHAAELKVLVEAVSKLPEDMANGLLAALGLDPELDAKIAAFAVQFAAFTAASDKLNDALDRDPTAEAIKALAAAHETTYSKALKARDGLADLLTKYDGSTKGTNDLAAATNAYVNAQVAALVEIENLKTGLGGMFKDSIAQLDWAILDNTQRGAFLLKQATDTSQLLRQTTDPTKIAEFSKLINKDLIDAFNLLSPAEQKVQHDAFVARLADADKLVQKQLEASRQDISKDNANAQVVLGNIRTAMDAAAAKQEAAAQALIDAAEIVKENALLERDTAIQNAATAAINAAAATAQQTAADTPVQINVTVSENTGP